MVEEKPQTKFIIKEKENKEQDGFVKKTIASQEVVPMKQMSTIINLTR